MKIFEKDTKVNFVDKNNRLVGYDMEANCCEDFGWYISAQDACPKGVADVADFGENLEPYCFEDVQVFTKREAEEDECGGTATFELTAKGKSPLYLTLYNFHNGYYSHGFEMRVGKKVLGCHDL
ncbi:MAG: hypothetical protein WC506_07045 [Candidatus Micrarchaeia archaeon]